MAVTGVYTFPSSSQVTLEHVREHLIKIKRVTQVEKWGARVRMLRSSDGRSSIQVKRDGSPPVPTLFAVTANHVENGQGALVVIEQPNPPPDQGSPAPPRPRKTRINTGYFSSSASLEALLARLKHRWTFRQSAGIDGFRCRLRVPYEPELAGDTKSDVDMETKDKFHAEEEMVWDITCGLLSIGDSATTKGKIFIMLSAGETSTRLPSTFSKRLLLIQTVLGCNVLPQYSFTKTPSMQQTSYEQMLQGMILELSTAPDSSLVMLRDEDIQDTGLGLTDESRTDSGKHEFGRTLYLILAAVRRATGM